MNCSDRRRNYVVLVLASALSCLFGTGCVVDQKKEVDTYRLVLDGPKPPAFDYKPGDPLSLEGALLLSNRNDEQLAASGETYLQALIDKERQFAAFLPTLSLVPTSTFRNFRGNGGASSVSNGAVSSSSGVSGPSAERSFTDVPVSSTANLFNGFQDISFFRRAGYTAEQQKALLLDLQQTTLLNVATTYYAVLTNERQVGVLLKSTELQNERVRDMESRLHAGVARPLDVAQSQAQAAATRVQLIQAQNNVRTSRIELAFLTDAPVQDAKLEDRLVVPGVLPPQDDTVKAAVKQRQDVQAAEAAIEAARQNVQAAIGQYYPSVSLNLEYWLHKEISTNLWDGILTYNIPIFIGTIHANVRTAYSQLRQAWLNAQRVHRLVSQQVRTAYENVIGSKMRLVDLEIEVAAARDALAQALSSYNAGLATNLDVLTAIDALNTAQLSLFTEQLNFKVFYLQLLRSEGVLTVPNSPLPPTTAPVSQPTVEQMTVPGVKNK